MSRLAALGDEISRCRRCPRLVAWREQVAADAPARHRGETYWARPVPGFGDPGARILVLGLAPAAQGGNRTGRVFTGDRSGDFLFAALHRARLANQPTSTHAGDGLRLHHTWISAAVRCAPPANRPTPGERDACLPWALAELAELTRLRVVVCLGAFAWDAALRLRAATGARAPARKPGFGHGTVFDDGGWLPLVGTFHPSQQNTFTGRLTPAMLDDVLRTARARAGVEA